MILLFVNFDGVLHPNAVHFIRKNTPVLDAPGHRLFESNSVLEKIAADFPGLRLTLNTWWTYTVGLDECLRRLPTALSTRVTGSILPHSSLCSTLPHRVSMASNAAENAKVPVLMLDHADARYPKNLRHRAFLLDPQVGLADPQAVDTFHRFLSCTTKLH